MNSATLSSFSAAVKSPDEANELANRNRILTSLSALERVQWACENLPDKIILSSSFGAQSAVSLHLVTQLNPDIPVLLIDTGYLFDETYRFIDQMQARLKLNLIVHRSQLSPGWIESRHGKLWEQGVAGIKQYNEIVKVKPMEAAMDQLDVGTWFAGLRQSQSLSRRNIQPLAYHHGRYKVMPIFDWDNRQVHQYLQQHNLPYHPLWEKGYVSIGDRHTSQPLTAGMLEQDTRFFGQVRECGIHSELV